MHQFAKARIVQAAPNDLGWRMTQPLWPIPDELIARLGQELDSFFINGPKPTTLSVGSKGQKDEAYEFLLEKQPAIPQVKRTAKLRFIEAFNAGETSAVT